jgi:hypothetical protein
VPQIISKTSQGRGVDLGSFGRSRACGRDTYAMISFKICNEDIPLTPPPSRDRIRSGESPIDVGLLRKREMLRNNLATTMGTGWNDGVRQVPISFMGRGNVVRGWKAPNEHCENYNLRKAEGLQTQLRRTFVITQSHPVLLHSAHTGTEIDSQRKSFPTIA